MGYKHLNIDERESILKMLSEEKNITHIAELLGRNKADFTSFYARATANVVSVMAVARNAYKSRIGVRLTNVPRLLMNVNALATGNRTRLPARAEAATLPAMWNVKAGIQL